jgi:hypothetical protein
LSETTRHFQHSHHPHGWGRRRCLGTYHHTHAFDSCKSMGDIAERNLDLMLGRHLV